ncbi:MAG: ABC transporter permease [Methylococcaceae bacterium]|nr:ABC transporter permease [Methylococcaceae bacterium]
MKPLDMPNPGVLNLRIAGLLGFRSLSRHRMVALATLSGIALGMFVVATILIVDFNTARTAEQRNRLDLEIVRQNRNNTEDAAPETLVRLPITRIAILPASSAPEDRLRNATTSAFPSQQLDPVLDPDNPPGPAGEEDYQTMRLAIRIASLLAFLVGGVVVFYTMRFSVASRSRELCLLRCLGEYRLNLAASLAAEAVVLGGIGTLLGLLLAFPGARTLLDLGISTTGRIPLYGFRVPYGELAFLALTSLLIALAGVAGPLYSLYKMQIAETLQPRYASDDVDIIHFKTTGFIWLLPPMLLAGYIAVRPFLSSWLSVVQLFVFESCFVLLISAATLWWTRPFLRFVIQCMEILLRSLLPLEASLSGRRMRLTSQKIVFSITSIVLVFSLLSGLHGVTRALKTEISRWSREALMPYDYFRLNPAAAIRFDEQELKKKQAEAGVMLFRLSAKAKGSLPIRLIRSVDLNPHRVAKGLEALGPGKVIFSRTLAARFGAVPGDRLLIESNDRKTIFDIIEVSDAVGFYVEDAQYIDMKSYALFSEGNPLFEDTLETTLGRYMMVRPADGKRRIKPSEVRDLFEPHYSFTKSGHDLSLWQLDEIDKDFLIFDFVLSMTIFLASIGVINTLLIQVHSRSREFALLTTLGMNRIQIVRILLVEGLIIGLVGAALATALGTALGFISVSFLNRFTLFEYVYIWSNGSALNIAGLAILCCSVSAIYPALVATRITSAESLHYE